MSENRKIGGAVVVEFAVVVLVLLTLLFGVLEVARVLYLWNTLHEVTRRAASRAAVVDLSDAGAMNRVRQTAVFQRSPGTLPLGSPVSDAHVRIDYLALARDASGALTLVPIPAGLLPACPARNMLNCSADPYGGSCIRFVRARICAADGDAACNAVPYAPLTVLTSLAIPLPTATAIVKAGTLGYRPGDAMCP